MDFKPYTHQQLKEIVSSRLDVDGLRVFEFDLIGLASRKVRTPWSVVASPFSYAVVILLSILVLVLVVHQ